MQVQITQYAIKLYFPQTLRGYDATISLANFLIKALLKIAKTLSECITWLMCMASLWKTNSPNTFDNTLDGKGGGTKSDKLLQRSNIICNLLWYCTKCLSLILHYFLDFNPLTPMSDQNRISPYNINTISTR